jgi:hypothetical protein
LQVEPDTCQTHVLFKQPLSYLAGAVVVHCFELTDIAWSEGGEISIASVSG